MNLVILQGCFFHKIMPEYMISKLIACLAPLGINYNYEYVEMLSL